MHRIANSPELLAEAKTALPGLYRDATWGASAAEIMAILAPRFALYPQPDRSDGEWDVWWADYTNALDDISPSAIEAAMAEYVKRPDSEFFPKPGKIRELAKTVPNPMARAADTAQRAIRSAEQLELAEREPPVIEAPASKEAVRDMLADFQRKMAERAPKPKPSLPPTPVRVDERGLSQAMREHMRGRQ